MNSKIKLVGLGATVAIALLLPSQARANAPTSLEDADGQPAALRSVEPLPDVILEGGAEEVGPDAITADASQQPQSPGIATVDLVNTSTNRVST